MTLGERASSFFRDLQDRVCAGLEELDGKARFSEDLWQRTGGGGGRTRVITDGDVFEKAGVNFSDVHGELPEEFAERIPGEGRNFRATGVSLVLHPRSPMVPAVHANFRFIEKGESKKTPWFGGGADLTPYYLWEEDAVHFHRTWKEACDRHDPDYYPRFKKWCDEYFRIEHRDEARGIGGIFCDYLKDDPEKVFAFVEDAGRNFIEAYAPIVERRVQEKWWDREREWQLLRRGRYVEFNLVYDRGTLFGLETHGRAESILMSLPPLVRWSYDHRPEKGSREETLLEALRKPVEWV